MCVGLKEGKLSEWSKTPLRLSDVSVLENQEDHILPKQQLVPHQFLLEGTCVFFIFL